MKLLTKSLEKKLRANNAAQVKAASDGKEIDHKAVVKFFTPDGNGRWYLSELDHNGLAFGVCDVGLGFPEYGYVTLKELQDLRGVLGLPIERDLYFDANKHTLKECLNRAKGGNYL
tara:strand:+ start:5409 stop:5756 length:348 start_codon:yes stop_codon:yes gene_type:complete